ncbi:hypothetical protein, partial [Brevundimonas sp.]|uniref:hypothetical protein n=1 Tax=Brevundimonas sp. TaxID=1871086 RepID=UPI0025BEF579
PNAGWGAGVWGAGDGAGAGRVGSGGSGSMGAQAETQPIRSRREEKRMGINLKRLAHQGK